MLVFNGFFTRLLVLHYLACCYFILYTLFLYQGTVGMGMIIADLRHIIGDSFPVLGSLFLSSERIILRLHLEVWNLCKKVSF